MIMNLFCPGLYCFPILIYNFALFCTEDCRHTNVSLVSNTPRSPYHILLISLPLCVYTVHSLYSIYTVKVGFKANKNNFFNGFFYDPALYQNI